MQLAGHACSAGCILAPTPQLSENTVYIVSFIRLWQMVLMVGCLFLQTVVTGNGVVVLTTWRLATSSPENSSTLESVEEHNAKK
jgi:hypothetical protein